ncbi:hypothetical protein ACFQ6C_26075 [Streptomyces sp. NPDC056454]|uniref:hypothetical protein n=1 Tax=Streptomyces sp. NPDC056454 TaxID=3345823 RepID=UPI00369E2EC6
MTSDYERRLLLTGTLDTSGVGGSQYEELPNVALAWREDDSVVLIRAGHDAVDIPLEELLVDGKDPSEAAAELEAATKTEEQAKEPPVKPVAKKTAPPKKRASTPAKS